MEYTLQQIIKSLNEAGILLCSADISEIENVIGLSTFNKLPETYIEFLKAMGNGTINGFLSGHSCFLDELPSLRKGAEELLTENHFNHHLVDDDFVFWMSQGYLFAFFKLTEGENPPIYYYKEGMDQNDFIKISDTLTEFLFRIQTKDKYLFHTE